jgi:membrane-bound metal-dependent hydrolase YbcI (DUF457 family)
MASPIGHAILGLAAGRGFAGGAGRRDLGWYAFAVFAATAPDLDFLPGFLVNEPFAFHRGATHSLAAAAAFGLAVWLLARGRVGRPLAIAATGTVAYLSHLLLDMPRVPLFWPISAEEPAIAWPSLPLALPWAHDSGIGSFLSVLLSTGFVEVALVEAAVYGPVLVAVWLLCHWRRRRAEGRWRPLPSRS